MNIGIASAKKIQISIRSSSITPVIARSVEIPAAGILAVKIDIVRLKSSDLIIGFMKFIISSN
tara:strand:- start:52646 stop:52834 length:189 start_codon:yes stop_codon:yes gene_type:complete